MDNARIQSLIDRNDIIDVFNRYAAGIDQKNNELYRSCFTDELEVDIGGDPREPGPADDWVLQAMNAVSAFETTQHIITNHSLTLAGDEADCVAYLQAMHWNPGTAFLVGGHYTNHLRRTEKGWRISRLCLSVTWTENRS